MSDLVVCVANFFFKFLAILQKRFPSDGIFLIVGTLESLSLILTYACKTMFFFLFELLFLLAFYLAMTLSKLAQRSFK